MNHDITYADREAANELKQFVLEYEALFKKYPNIAVDVSDENELYAYDRVSNPNDREYLSRG